MGVVWGGWIIEVVGTPVDAHCGIRMMGSADVRVGGDHRKAEVISRLKIRGSCSAVPVSGAPSLIRRPNASSRPGRSTSSQVSSVIAIRRSTKVVAPT